MRAAPVLMVTLLLAPALAAPAEAVSIRDIVELSSAGLADDVLLALIEVDGTVFPIDAALIRALKESGVSDRVIGAMIRSGRPVHSPDPVVLPVPVQEPPLPSPQVVVIERHEPAREVRAVIVYVPVYVPAVTTRSFARRGAGRNSPAPRTGFEVHLPQIERIAEPARPVYWGWGGKLRPDAWKPAGYREEMSKKTDEKKRR